MYKRLNSLPR